jgi:hypothetical protein
MVAEWLKVLGIIQVLLSLWVQIQPGRFCSKYSYRVANCYCYSFRMVLHGSGYFVSECNACTVFSEVYSSRQWGLIRKSVYN